MQPRLKIKDRLTNLSEKYQRELKAQRQFMDLTTFLEKWVPVFFPGIYLYDKRKQVFYYSVTQQNVQATYKEACALLLSNWYPFVTLTTLNQWGASDSLKCPDAYKAGLYHIDMTLEYNSVVEDLVAKQEESKQRVA